jgi:DNA-directed RNA polymerase specialized sigma24 family protein
MSTPSEPGGTRPDPGLDAVMSERRQLINLAYRLLGSLAEAEDAVQDTYARWYAMSRQERDAIASPGAWLSKVTSRICLNLLSSARARREAYVGEWIPEPLPEFTEWTTGLPGGTAMDPADRVTLDESVSMALLAASSPRRPAGASAPRTLPRPRQPSEPASSGTSGRRGKRRTSMPSLACLTPTPRSSRTAVAW